jgi:[pyruvate, water dikinase]-phosphate phosphotransferase / [pyruvate, water dikinase] kinase
MKRTVFYISDSTGITAETLGHSLITQFPQFEFEQIAIPYVNSLAKAQEVALQINQTSKADKVKVIVFSTLVKPEIRNVFIACDCLFMDFFDILIGPLEEELKSKYAQDIGKFHTISNIKAYDARIAAIDFALKTDDGISLKDYNSAELILLGVSRSGKTPTCLYLALKFGIFAANYPLTEEDLASNKLPETLLAYKDKLFGLIITPERLQQIRQQRMPNSKYASMEQCQKELKAAKHMLDNVAVPYLESTSFSIEEIAAQIITKKQLKRHLF